MYNSRPRYARLDDHAMAIRVPRNSSGTAFGDDFIREDDPEHIPKALSRPEEPSGDAFPEKEKIAEPIKEQSGNMPIQTNKDETEAEECSALPKKKSFFGNIGFEELLIIGLIFLISQSEGNEDVILLLVLLFFIN